MHEGVVIVSHENYALTTEREVDSATQRCHSIGCGMCDENHFLIVSGRVIELLECPSDLPISIDNIMWD